MIEIIQINDIVQDELADVGFDQESVWLQNTVTSRRYDPACADLSPIAFQTSFAHSRHPAATMDLKSFTKALYNMERAWVCRTIGSNLCEKKPRPKTLQNPLKTLSFRQFRKKVHWLQFWELLSNSPGNYLATTQDGMPTENFSGIT